MTIDNATTAGDVQTVMLAGQRFVIVPEGEYRRLQQAVEAIEPELPPADARGYYPAVETVRAMLARGHRPATWALGLSQADLARRAGIRPETLNRLEQASTARAFPRWTKSTGR